MFHCLVTSFVQTSTFTYFWNYTYTYSRYLTHLRRLFQSILNGYRMEAFSKVSRKSFNFMDIWKIKLWLHHKPFCVLWHVWVSLDILSCLAVFAEFDPDQPLSMCMWICRQYSKHLHYGVHSLSIKVFSGLWLSVHSASLGWIPCLASHLWLHGLRICAVWSVKAVLWCCGPNNSMCMPIFTTKGSGDINIKR